MIGIIFANRVVATWRRLRFNDSKAKPIYAVHVLEDFASLASTVDDDDITDDDGDIVDIESDEDGHHLQVSDLQLAKSNDVRIKRSMRCHIERHEVQAVRRKIHSTFSMIAMEVFTVFIDKYVLANMSHETLVMNLDSFTDDTLSIICPDRTVGGWIVQLAVSLGHGGRARTHACLKTDVEIDKLTQCDIAEVLIVCINKILRNRGVNPSELAKEIVDRKKSSSKKKSKIAKKKAKSAKKKAKSSTKATPSKKSKTSKKAKSARLNDVSSMVRTMDILVSFHYSHTVVLCTIVCRNQRHRHLPCRHQELRRISPHPLLLSLLQAVGLQPSAERCCCK